MSRAPLSPAADPVSRPPRRLAWAALGLLALASFGGLNGAVAAIRVTDAAGQGVVLAAPARRIVSLAPHISELLFEIGAGRQLVGAVDYSDYPPASRRIPRVGDSRYLDLEAIVALHPDLVIGWLSGNRPGDIARLRGLGIPVYLSEPRRLGDIPLLMRRLGTLTGRERRAHAVAAAFDRRLGGLRKRYQSRAPVSVFFEVWNRPLMTLNGKHPVSDAIRLCGGRNVFAARPTLASTVSLEAVLAADPDVIVSVGAGEEGKAWLDSWRRWPHLRAVRKASLYHIRPDLLLRPTSRILQGAAELCRDLAEARRADRD